MNTLRKICYSALMLVACVLFMAPSSITVPGGGYIGVGPTNINAYSDVVTFINSIQSVGIQANNNNPSTTNLVDALFLHPRFGVWSNSLSWAGQTITMSNVTRSPWGVGLAGNSLVKLPISNSVTNTLVIFWRGYISNFFANVGYNIAGLYNADPLLDDGEFFRLGSELHWNLRKTNTWYNSGGNETVMQPWWYNSYTYTACPVFQDQINFTAVSSDGQGNYAFWWNGASKYGLSSPVFNFNNVAIVPTNLNLLQLGIDTLGPGGSFAGAYFPGEVNWAGVFNKPLDTNQLYTLYRAVRDLGTETTFRAGLGDSLMSISSVTNQDVMRYMMRSRPNEVNWMNWSQGGRRASEALTATLSNNLFFLNAPSTPTGKVGRCEVYIGGGINDFYGGGASADAVSNSLYTTVLWASSMGWRPYVMTVTPVWTNSNAFTWAQATEDKSDALNTILITNNWSYGIIRRDAIFGFSETDTNLNKFSADGLHPFGPYGSNITTRIANQMSGIDPPPSGNIVTVMSAYTAKVGDRVVRASTGSAFTVKLPSAPLDREQIKVIKISADANVLTISGNGHNINGAASVTTSTQWGSFTLQYDSATGTWN